MPAVTARNTGKPTPPAEPDAAKSYAIRKRVPRAVPEAVFYSEPELMALLAIRSRTTIARLVERGDLPAPVRFGKIRRWRRDDIAAVFAKNEVA